MPDQPTAAPKPRRTIGYWLRLVLFFIVTLWLALNVMMGLRGAYGVANPAKGPPCCLTPAEYAGLDYEDVTFPARDGLQIAAWYIPSRNGAAVILSHSHSSNRAMTLPVAVMLADAGYGVLMIDLRAHGESEDTVFTLWQAGDDVLGGVKYLQGRPEVDPDRIGAWGFSAGAAASVHAAARSEDIRAVMADGLSWTRFKDAIGLYRARTIQFLIADLVQMTATEWFYAPGSLPRALVDDVALIPPRPVLAVVAEDNFAGNEMLAAEQYQAIAGESLSIWVVEGTLHGGGWDVHPEEYRQRLLSFFDQALNALPAHSGSEPGNVSKATRG
jgi:pimeloyl-ACP methyl ester carboxylesterase